MRFTIIPLLLLAFTSCSLLKVEVENPQEPLSSWQMNLRTNTHTYAGAMNQYVSSIADSLLSKESKANVKINAILWKISFTSTIRKSAFATDPELAFLDTWAFIKQQDDFFAENTAEELFSANLKMVRFCSDSLLRAVELIAHNIYSPREFDERHDFIYHFAAEEHLANLSFQRNFILFKWKEYLNIPDTAVVSTVGTLPQVMSDFSEKMGFYSETGPDQIKWQMDLIKMGFSTDSTLQAEIDSIRSMVKRLVYVAENSPEIIDSTMQQIDAMLMRLEKDFNAAVFVFDKNWANTIDKLSEEREALVEALSRERALAVEELDDISVKVADQALGHIKGIIRSMLIFAILLILLLFGIPFFSGYLLGKAIQKRKKD